MTSRMQICLSWPVGYGTTVRRRNQYEYCSIDEALGAEFGGGQRLERSCRILVSGGGDRPVGIFILSRSLLRPFDVHRQFPGLDQKQVSQHVVCARRYGWQPGLRIARFAGGGDSVRRSS